MGPVVVRSSVCDMLSLLLFMHSSVPSGGSVGFTFPVLELYEVRYSCGAGFGTCSERFAVSMTSSTCRPRLLPNFSGRKALQSAFSGV